MAYESVDLGTRDRHGMAIGPVPVKPESTWSQICSLIVLVIVMSAGAALAGGVEDAAKKQELVEHEHIENDPRTMVAAGKVSEQVCEAPTSTEGRK